MIKADGSKVLGARFFDRGTEDVRAKRALSAYLHDVATGLAPRRIRANVVPPTNVSTAMLHSDPMYRVVRPDLVHPTREDAELTFTVQQAMPIPCVEPEDISSAVLWLASDEARASPASRFHEPTDVAPDILLVTPRKLPRKVDVICPVFQCDSVPDDDRTPRLTAARIATRESILDACWQCLVVTGPTSLKIADVCREAEVSRVTFYQYFRDRDDVIRAMAEHVSARFYAELGSHMDGGETFAEQCFRASDYVCSGKEFENIGYAVEIEHTALLMTVHSRALLIGCIDMLSPRIEEAKASGELRADVPTPVAAEMFARFLFSLVTTPAANLDTSDPAVVRELIAENLLKGWT